MSNKNDKRVVEMELENSNFERNARTSMDTLDRLKDKMDLSEASKKGLGTDSLAKGIDVLKDKFSALSIIGITALQNITNKAVDAGLKIANALTIEPVMDGFNEYELKMGSIQTILTNTQDKGTTIEDINKALDELNHYADLTVYSFADMTKAIGQFTTAGTSLEDSVTAVKGFSNLAAGTGANNANLTRAEYQMSQMLQSGYMQLMDWRSMENSGMGGALLQKALIETAKELHGSEKEYADVLKEIENHEVSFRDSLSKKGGGSNYKWLTAEVFLATMKKFAEDPSMMEAATKVRTMTQLFDVIKEELGSGWANSFEIIIGDFDAASVLLTDLSETMQGIFQKQSQARNEMLKEWADNGGRDALIEAIKNSWEALKSIIKPITEGFKNIFPPITAQRLVDLTKKLRDFTAGLKISEESQEKIKNVTKGLVSILDSLAKGLSKVGSYLLSLGAKIAPIIGGILSAVGTGLSSILGIFGGGSENEMPDEIKKLAENEELLKKHVSESLNPLKSFGDKIKEVKDRVKEFLVALKDNGISKWNEMISNAIKKMSEAVHNGLEAAKNSISSFFGLLNKPVDLTAFASVEKKAKETSEGVKNSFSLTNLVPTNLFDGLKDSPFVKGVINFFSYIAETTKNGIQRLSGVVKSLVSNILDEISGMNLTDVLKTALTASRVRNSWKFGSLLGNMTDFFGPKGLSKTLTDAVQFVPKAFENIGKGFENLTSPVKKLGEVIESYKKEKLTGILKDIALAIVALTGSMYVLSKIPTADLGKAAVAITAMVGELLGSVYAFGKLTNNIYDMGMMNATIGFILKLSIAVALLSSSLKKLSSIDFFGLIKGLYGLGGLLLAIFIFTRELNSIELAANSLKKVLLLVAISFALGGFVKQLKILSNIPMAAILSGLGGMLVLMGEMLGFMAILKKITINKDDLFGIITLVMVAQSMGNLVKAIQILGDLSIEQLAKGIVGLGTIMLEMVGFSKIVGNGRFTDVFNLSFSTNIIALGFAIKSFAKAVGDMGSLSLPQIGKGLLGIGGALAIIAGAMHFMPKSTILIGAGLIVVGAALKIIASAVNSMGGMSWEEIGKGLVTLAGALTIITVAMNFMTSGIAGAAAMIIMSAALALFVPVLAMLGNLPVSVIATGLLAMAGAFVVIGGTAAILTPLTPVLAALAVGLAAVGVAVLSAGAGCLMFATAITELAAIGGAGVAAIMLLIDGIIQRSSELAGVVGECFIGIFESITQNAPKVMAAIAVIVGAIVQGLIQNIPVAISGIIQFVTALLQALASNAPQFIKAGADFIVNILTGLANKLPDIIVAAFELILSFIQGLAQGIPLMIQGGIDIAIAFIDGLANGLENNRERFIKAIHNLCVQGLLTVLAFFGIHSPSKVMAGVGENVSEGLIVGIDSKNLDVKSAFEQMGLSGLSGLDFLDSSMNAKGGSISDEYINGLMKNQNGVADVSSLLGENTLEGLSPFEGEMNLEGMDLSKALSDGLGSGTGDMQDMSSLLGESGLQGIDSYKDVFNLEGTDLSSMLVQGFSSKSGEAKSAGGDLGDNIDNGLRDRDDIIKGHGGKYVNKLDSGIKDKHHEALEAGKTLGTKIANGVGSKRVENEMKKVGRELVNGLIKGIEEKSDKLEDAGSDMGKKVLNSTKKKLAIASPSKEMERIGMYTDEGLANGIKKFSGQVFGSVDDVNSGLIGTFSSIMSKIASIMDDNMDLDPVIRPVLDTSSVEDNMNRMGSLFGDETIKMNEIGSVIYGLNPRANSVNGQNVSINDVGIITAINNLHGDISSMMDRIGQLQVIMDTGALVGQLTTPMDNALGARIYRNWRESEA